MTREPRRRGTAMRARRRVRRGLAPSAAVFLLLMQLTGLSAADDLSTALPTKALPLKAPPRPQSYDWTGFYVGGHAGYAWGTSNWTLGTPGAPDISGSINLYESLNSFNESGSWFMGFQGGYNYMLPNRVVIGAEADLSGPSFQTLNGISIGGISNFTSPVLGPESYSETMLNFGSVRGRVGYAPGNWLFYATGGFAWAYDQITLTQLSTGTTDMPFLWRLGWTAGLGVEIPIAPHWTTKLEYMYSDLGRKNEAFQNVGQNGISDFNMQTLRAGLNYQFNNDATPSYATLPGAIPDLLNIRGQATFVEQAYPRFQAPYDGQNSLPSSGQGRETFDAILFVGVRLWQGAEFWIDPEVDQGHGLAETHGIAGFPNGESYKLGFSYPYARDNRYFIRQTIDLGGDSVKVEADQNVFAGTTTGDRLVLTVGKFYEIDIFDKNKYANDPKSDFLNWSVINAATYDFGSDAWSTTYGAAAELYKGNWAFRLGLFEMAQTPAGGGGDSALAYGLDPTLHNIQWLGEVEYRYSLSSQQPGKIKVTGFLIRGDMGSYEDAVALSQNTGLDVSDALAAVRHYQSRPGVSVNLEQQLTETVGLFARAGWADGNVECWNNTDADRTIEAGLSFNGKPWNRPDDTIGVAAVANGISKEAVDYFNAGGLGIVIGDGQLPHPGLEQIIEAYYSYTINSQWKASFDYQFVVNPGYNTDRGPVNIFAGRLHWQF
jgi:high affinity Mn2+ porin